MVRQDVIESYVVGLKVVFIFQAAVAFLALLTSLPIEENFLPSSHEEEAEHDAWKRAQQESSIGMPGE